MFSRNPTTKEIFRARVFENPLVPLGAEPTADENAAIAAALLRYANRSGPHDFSSLAGFLEAHPTSPWNASLLTNLGLEYYRAAHYSRTMEVWRQAWELASGATDLHGRSVADRAVGELAYMYSRLGRMPELDALLASVKDRQFSGAATERISGARHGLSNMRTHPEFSFRCGPLALHRIQLAINPKNPGTEIIQATESTQDGFSLCQVAELSCRLGLDFQMAFREIGADIVVPSVVHLKVDHFAAIVRQDGDSYLLQDPTFWNDVWITREVLEAEASGYFLAPPGDLPSGWRNISPEEGGTVWGKGNVGPGPKPPGPCDPHTNGGDSCGKKDDDCKGMAVPRVHLLAVSLNINDEPVGYAPPVGPAVRFMVRYNQRDSFQPDIFSYSNFGPKWTFDWLSYITEEPANPLGDVSYYIMGGGTRTFTGFDNSTQSFAFHQLDQTRLTRISPGIYEMLSPDGTRKIFSQSDGAVGTSRKIFLTDFIDRLGNAATLQYDADLRLVEITDAIKQVTVIAYENPADIHKITKVTDPFGRFATFVYDDLGRLSRITDVIGITSEFTYEGRSSDFIITLKTPYGITTFTKSEAADSRSLETVYPDGNRDRVEFRNTDLVGNPLGFANDTVQSLPTGMATTNDFLFYRNTFYWSKIACATAYGDYRKAKIYHWCHASDLHTAEAILESVKEPLEGRVWYDYAGQASTAGESIVAGSTNKPAHIGRVLDDGSTQLYTYEYNDFGHVTKSIDPVGRTFSHIYDANGIDLLETRQTRDGQNELMSQATYNEQHLPLTQTDAAGQTTTYTYNTVGQVLTVTNAKAEAASYSYDDDGALASVNGPLPAARISFTYDSMRRVQTRTDETGYVLTFGYDALDRPTKITYPDSTSDQFTYSNLDRTMIRDRAERRVSFDYDSVQQMTRRIDALDRTTLFQWCKCGALKGLTDPMGRTTTWGHDVQGRLTNKQYVDGSRVTYRYEKNTGRMSQKIDEQFQVTEYHYNRDNTLKEQCYTNTAVATPSVRFIYDANYYRVRAMTDGTGVTLYDYNPITPVPGLGAGQLASIDGPVSGDTITYAYDELGRPVARGINGATAVFSLDAANRITMEVNSLGSFSYIYDGVTRRRLSASYPNGQTATFSYLDDRNEQKLEKVTYTHGTNLISEFIHAYDVPRDRITNWSQKAADQPPVIYALDYDAADQLTSVTGSQSGGEVSRFRYTYDPAGNRLTEQIGNATSEAFYNALNELTTTVGGTDSTATYDWDAEHRLAAVNSGNERTEFAYDGLGRRVGIRRLVKGSEVSNRRFLWCGDEICVERTLDGTISKRFFARGMKIETGAAAGAYYYTVDHLGSIRDVTDSDGKTRARYSYDPFGRRTEVAEPRLATDAANLEADFGFAGMFFCAEANLNLTRFRPYDPVLGRWLSRDPLKDAEFEEGVNLFTYVHNNPANLTDPLGLCCESELIKLHGAERDVSIAERYYVAGIAAATASVAAICLLTAGTACAIAAAAFLAAAFKLMQDLEKAANALQMARELYDECTRKGCGPCIV